MCIVKSKNKTTAAVDLLTLCTMHWLLSSVSVTTRTTHTQYVGLSGVSLKKEIDDTQTQVVINKLLLVSFQLCLCCNIFFMKTVM